MRLSRNPVVSKSPAPRSGRDFRVDAGVRNSAPIGVLLLLFGGTGCGGTGTQLTGDWRAPAPSAHAVLSVVGLGLDSVVFVPFRWPPVGAALGDAYDRRLDQPVAQFQMSSEFHIGLVRSFMSRSRARFDELGYRMRMASRLPVASDSGGDTPRSVLLGRLANFSLETHQRTGTDLLQVDLGVIWDLVDRETGRTVYSLTTWAKLDGEVIADQLGSFLAISRSAMDETLEALFSDPGLVEALRELSGTD